MRRFPSTPRKKSRIEIIPMIDVMMFLLVFFVLLSINVIPATGLKLKLPVASQAQDSRPPIRALVGIPVQGEYMLDGQAVSNLASLGEILKQRKTQAKQGLVVVLQGDQQTSLQRVVDVMNMLKAQGIESIHIAAKK